jgi:beta-lactamase class A
MRPTIQKILLCALLASHCLSATAQNKTALKLQQQINGLIKDFKGSIGIYIKNLQTQKTVAINADTVFPTASIVKVPIMIGIVDKINKGELGYHQELTYKDSLLYAGEDILGSFKSDEKIELSKVLMLMMTTSDNTASLWLQSLAGTGTRINEILDSLQVDSTRVNSRTQGREANRKQYGWGQTTPREMAKIFELIQNEKLISKAASQKMKRLLSRQYWDEEAISSIPPNASILCKNGAVDASRSEVLLITSKNSTYILSIFTKNIADTSWKRSNEAWELTRKIASLVYNHFNPTARWTEDADAGRFR